MQRIRPLKKYFQKLTFFGGKGGILTGDIDYYIAAILIYILFFLVLVAYLGQLIVALFRMTMLAILSPFLLMALAFGWSRSMAFSGVRTFIGTIIVLFSATTVLGLIIFGVTQLGSNNLQDSKNILFDPEFLVIVFLGIAGTALMTEGVSIANSVAQTALTNTAAGAFTRMAGAAAGAAVAPAAAASIMAGGGAMKGAGYVAGAAGATNTAQSIKEKFNNSRVGQAASGALSAGQSAMNNFKSSNIHQGGAAGASKGADLSKAVGKVADFLTGKSPPPPPPKQ